MNTTTSTPVPVPSVSGRAAIVVIAGIVALGPGIFWIFLVVAGIVGLVRSFTWLRPERATPPQQ